MRSTIAALVAQGRAVFTSGSPDGRPMAVVAIAGLADRQISGLLPDGASLVETPEGVAAVLPDRDDQGALEFIQCLVTAFPNTRTGYSWSDGHASLHGLIVVARQALATGRQGRSL